MSFRFTFPRLHAFDANGDPLSGGKLWFYQTGTTTPLNTFSEETLTTANTNPVEADSAGRFGDIYLGTGTYKVVLTDDADVAIWTADPVKRSAESSAFMDTVLSAADAAAARAALGAGTASYPAKGTDVASAATLTLPASEADQFFDVTGTTTVTAISTRAAGRVIVLKFEDVLTLTHNATDLVLPGGANITTAAGDVAVFVSEGSGDWRCVSYSKANGRAVVSVSRIQGTTIVQNPTAVNSTITGAHGLGAEPHEVRLELECLTADLNYSTGEKVQISDGLHVLAGSSNGLAVLWDATNVTVIYANNSRIVIPNKTTRGMAEITAANWRLNIYPIRWA